MIRRSERSLERAVRVAARRNHHHVRELARIRRARAELISRARATEASAVSTVEAARARAGLVGSRNEVAVIRQRQRHGPWGLRVTLIRRRLTRNRGWGLNVVPGVRALIIIFAATREPESQERRDRH